MLCEELGVELREEKTPSGASLESGAVGREMAGERWRRDGGEMEERERGQLGGRT